MGEQEPPRSNDLLEQAYRAPLWVTLVFVVTMVAIWMLGREVWSFYEVNSLPVTAGEVR